MPKRDNQQLPSDVRDAGAPSAARVAWISGTYGFSGDLAYWREIFGRFAADFPEGFVPVARDFPVERYPELPLRPILDFHFIGRTSRQVGTVTYDGRLRVPTVRTLLRLVRMRLDALLLIEFSPTALCGFAVAKVTRARTVLLVESDPSYRGAPQSRAVRTLKRFVARHVDVVLVSNEIGAQFVRRDLGVTGAKLRIGPYLTSSPAHPSVTSVTTTPLVSAASPDEPARLLFLNSVSPRKGLRQLIDALAAADVDSSRWRLDIVGDGPELDSIRVHLDELHLTERCTFHGRVGYEGTPAFYEAADVVVCPTLADYRSLAGFEAVNAGKPLIMSRYDGAHVELEQFGGYVVVVDPQDAAGFAAALGDLLRDPDTLRDAAAKARNVPVCFSMETIASNISGAVTAALGRRP